MKRGAQMNEMQGSAANATARWWIAIVGAAVLFQSITSAAEEGPHDPFTTNVLQSTDPVEEVPEPDRPERAAALARQGMEAFAQRLPYSW